MDETYQNMRDVLSECAMALEAQLLSDSFFKENTPLIKAILADARAALGDGQGCFECRFKPGRTND